MPDNPTGESCETCRYYQGFDLSICRRHAPTPMQTGDRADWFWPIVGETWWCGEYVAATVGGK